MNCLGDCERLWCSICNPGAWKKYSAKRLECDKLKAKIWENDHYGWSSKLDEFRSKRRFTRLEKELNLITFW